MTPEVEGLTVLKPAHAFDHPKATGVELDGQRGTNKLGAWRIRHKAVHPAIFVALPVEQRDVGELCWVHHFGDCLTDGVIGAIFAGVNERGSLVGDQELIERDVIGGVQVEMR